MTAPIGVESDPGCAAMRSPDGRRGDLACIGRPLHKGPIDVHTRSCSAGRTSARNPVRIPRRCPPGGKLLELSDDLVQTPFRSSDQLVYPRQRRADTTREPLINRERSERHAPRSWSRERGPNPRANARTCCCSWGGDEGVDRVPWRTTAIRRSGREGREGLPLKGPVVLEVVVSDGCYRRWVFHATIVGRGMAELSRCVGRKQSGI